MTLRPHRPFQTLLPLFMLLLIAGIVGAHVIRQDERQAAAERAYQEASRLAEQGTPEALRASIEKLKEASALFRAADDPGRAALMLLLIARNYYGLEEKQKTVEYAGQALAAFRALGNPAMEANAHSLMGGAYLDLGNHQQALDSYTQELALWQKVENRKRQALALSNIGLVYYTMGDKRKALDYYDQAIRFVNDLDDPRQKARLYQNLGELYAELEENEIAQGFLQVAISIHKRLGNDEEAGRLQRILEKTRTPQTPQTAVTAQSSGSNQQPSLVVQLGHASFVTALSFSPDGRFILTGGQDASARLWEAATGIEIRRFTGHGAAISEVAFAADGKQVVTSSLDGTARVWESETGREVRRLSAPQSVFRLSPDGRFALSCCDGHTGSLWDVATGKEIKRYEKPIIGPAVAFSPDSKLVVTGVGVRSDATQAYKPAVILWDTATGQPVWQFDGHRSVINSVAFSADGKFVLTGSGGREGQDNTARLLDAKTGREVQRFEHQEPVIFVSLSPDGRTAATAAVDESARLWDVATGKESRRFDEPASNVNVAVFSPGGEFVAVGSGGGVNLYDAATGKPARRLTGYAYETAMSTVSPDGRFIATANSYSVKGGGAVGVETGGAVCLWDIQKGQEVERAAAPDVGVSTLAYSDDNRLLLIGQGTAASLRDLSAGKEIKRFTTESQDKLPNADAIFSTITALALSRDNQFVLTGIGSVIAGGSNYVVLWSAQTGAEVSRFQLTGEVKTVAFSPDGRRVLTGSGGHVIDGKTGYLVEQEKAVILREAVGGKEIKRFGGNRAIYSRDGKYLLTSGTEDRSAHLWDAASLKELRVLQGHPGEVEALSFSDDNRYILTGDFRGGARLWETETGKLLKAFETRAGGVQSVSLVGDNRFVLTLGGDSVVRLWSIKTGQEVCRLISFRDGTWITVDMEGRFDTNNLEDIRGLHWVMPDDPLRPLPLEIFMRDYYEPRLLPRIMAGEKLKPVRSLSSLNRAQPSVKIIGIEPQPDQPDRVAVTVEVAQAATERRPDNQATTQETGVYDLRLFRDGQLVEQLPAAAALAVASTPAGQSNDAEELRAWRQSTEVKLDGNGRKTIRFENIRLPRRQGIKQTEFSAYAFNADKVKSGTARQSFALPQNLTPVKGHAYIITVGVSAYENADFNLDFAADDARRVQQVVSENLKTTGAFAEVISVALLSDYEIKAGRKVATLKQATKENFKTVLQLLSNRSRAVDAKQLAGITNADKLLSATPDDLILIMFSSHGYADRNGNFYFIPYDTGTGRGKVFTPQVKAHSINSEELSLWLRDVDAGEMVMIVDACHSAAAIEGQEFKPGPMGSRGLGQLSYDKGMRILTATQSDNVAWEYPTLKQGVLTYALIRDGIEARQADFKPLDRRIMLAEWLEYGADRVPKLYEEVRRGKVQTFGAPASGQPKLIVTSGNGSGAGTGKALEEVILKGKTQQPSLFDFSRRRQDILLLSSR